jgi:hypothetical protein
MNASPPPARLSLKLPLILFFLAALLFVAAQGLIFHWFYHPDAPLGSSADAFMFDLLPSTGQDDPTAEVSALDLARRHAARQRQVKIYFTTDGLKLQPQTVTLTKPLTTHGRLRFMLETLLEGPLTDTYQRTVPQGTRLRGVYIQNDRAIVDLQGDLLSRPQGGAMAEILCVYAIVNTITENIDSIKEVQILVQGRKEPLLWDQIDLRGPFMGNTSLIEN